MLQANRQQVSINSTSEEVRSFKGAALLLLVGLVSINSTSEEVRSGIIGWTSCYPPVSINSTSEEVRRVGF